MPTDLLFFEKLGEAGSDRTIGSDQLASLLIKRHNEPGCSQKVAGGSL